MRDRAKRAAIKDYGRSDRVTAQQQRREDRQPTCRLKNRLQRMRITQEWSQRLKKIIGEGVSQLKKALFQHSSTQVLMRTGETS